MKLRAVDYSILALYFCFVLGIGWKLRKTVTSAGEFLTAGHHVPVWITSLAFLAANLGAPAMVFADVFMMPFYYGSKAGPGRHHVCGDDERLRDLVMASRKFRGAGHNDTGPLASARAAGVQSGFPIGTGSIS